MSLLNEALIRKAAEIAGPGIIAILQEKETIWGPEYVYVKIEWTEQYGDGFIQTHQLTFIFGNVPDEPDQEKDFEAIAAEKLGIAKLTNLPTSIVIDQYPWLVPKGKKLYPGGVPYHGIFVGTSGAKGRTDEAISWHIINIITLLSKLKADKIKENHPPVVT